MKYHNIDTKKCLMRSLMFPIFMYASEYWTLKKSDLCKIDSFEMTCWRRMVRIPWIDRQTNQSMINKLQIKDGLNMVIKCRIMTFSRHTIRRDCLEKHTSSQCYWS